MAAKYRKIDPRIWNDEKFCAMTMEEKIMAFWLLTNSRLNRIGIVLWSPGLASEETGIDRHRVDTVCHTVCHTLNWVVDTPSKTVYLTTWWKYNSPDNESALKGQLEDLHDLPKHNLNPHIIKACEYLKPSLRHLVDTVCPTVSDTVPPTVSPQKQKQKQKQEQEDKSPPPPATGGDDQTAAATVPPAPPPPPKAKRKAALVDPNFDPMTVILPFKSDRFREAWSNWVEYRRIRKPALTEVSVRQQLKDFIAWGEDAAIAAIGDAIRSQWQGLFPPKGGTVNPSGYKSKAERDNEIWIENAQSCLE